MIGRIPKRNSDFHDSGMEKEEEYLREQHKRGWKFVKVKSIGFYHLKSVSRKMLSIS